MSMGAVGSSTLRSVVLVLYLRCCQEIRSTRHGLAALNPVRSIETSEVELLATDKIILQTMHMHGFVKIQ